MVRSKQQQQQPHRYHHHESIDNSNHHLFVFNDTYRDVISTTCTEKMKMMKMMNNTSSSRLDHGLCITDSSTIPSAVMHLVMSSKVR